MLNELYQIILNRRETRPPGSYTVELLDRGENRILQKIGEEAVEVVLAAKSEGKHRLVEETADLFYHTLVLLAAADISLKSVEDELRRRHVQKKS